MKRPRSSSVLLLALAACAPRAEVERPNVVLIVVDSLRPDHLGCYGYGPPTSPAIDRLAASGVRFETAVSSTSWTLPAHAALFTGLFDSAHGLRTPYERLDPDLHTLAEALSAAGYRTAGFYGGPFLHPTFGLDQGFATWVGCMNEVADDLGADRILKASIGNDPAANRGITGPRTLAAVEAWLEGAPAEPFFLFVHLWDVHYDFVPHPGLTELFDADYEGALDASDFDANPALHADMDPRELRHLLALYDGEIRFTDGIVEGLLSAVHRRSAPERTLVILTADHGEEFFEHGGKGHQHTLYDELVKVPLIVSWPGQLEAGRAVTDQVRLVDVKPTVLALIGRPDGDRVSGRDLGPLLSGGALQPAPALIDLAPLVVKHQLHGLRTEEAKVISRSRGATGFGFDLRADPSELHRLRDDQRLLALLSELRTNLERTGQLREELEVGETPAEMSADLRARLEDLGYLDMNFGDEE